MAKGADGYGHVGGGGAKEHHETGGVGPQKSGCYGDKQHGPTRIPASHEAGAGRVKGGAHMKSQVQPGLKEQKSGNRGG